MDALNIHRVETHVELDEVIVSNLHDLNAVLVTDDDLQAAAKLLEEMRRLPEGEALVVRRGNLP